MKRMQYKAVFSDGTTAERAFTGKDLTHAWRILFTAESGEPQFRVGFSTSERQARVNAHKEMARDRILAEEIVAVTHAQRAAA